MAPYRVLDNGENDRMLLDLRQIGAQVNGTVTTIGHVFQLEGTMTGNHFAMFTSKRDIKPRMVGDVAGNELHLTWEGHPLVAVPAKPGDEYPTFEHIEPPALHNVPYNGLAKTPPMGWNSWNLFQSTIDDKTVREIADAMVTSGMRDAGYVYVNIDDTWQGVRDAQGNLQPNKKFPDMKALADYVHSKGLKLGIYSSPGPRTCADYPGSYGHEEQDAKTYAAWGIDYLKYDWCGARMIYSNDVLQPVYQKMGDALLKAGRPIVYSLCEYGNGHVETWGAKVGGNLWRTTGDITDTWAHMIANIEKQVPTAPYAGPGHWNDPDMLEIGNGHMTDEEYRTHMSLWALSAGPLLAGNDIRSMTPAIKEILLNREVIAVDQDALGRQATPVKNGDLETWVKPLANGSVAVGVVNMSAAETTASVKASDLGLGNKVKSARDLWRHTNVKFRNGVYTAKIPPHGVLMLRVSAKK
ncbi:MULTISPECIES: glycoside hydrolase family 27 protein [Acidobacteriaceae]|uniref:glycoside hydrolase family 27 protein n=1 Tax=Acidobacteriaceae TaxID=204434 RepID=UPI0020B140FE|nr:MULTISPECIES: glycoside hydrolase family 27 protein [Acidobacteriaceae]MDW5267437.1 glycoside hydrolase family 27 protein [Edaphobacter sp.]